MTLALKKCPNYGNAHREQTSTCGYCYAVLHKPDRNQLRQSSPRDAMSESAAEVTESASAGGWIE